MWLYGQTATMLYWLSEATAALDSFFAGAFLEDRKKHRRQVTSVAEQQAAPTEKTTHTTGKI